jgi:hypothetical protein
LPDMGDLTLIERNRFNRSLALCADGNRLQRSYRFFFLGW